MKKTIYTIYRAFCIPSGKSYIGFTKHTIENRLVYHKSKARTGGSYAFHCAIRKYGIEAFRFDCLLQTTSRNKALKAEVAFIKEYNSRCEGNGYNMTEGGEAMKGYVWPEKVKEKIKAKHRVRFKGERNPNFGKKTSNSTKEKIREWSKANPDRCRTKRFEEASASHIRIWTITFPDGHEEIITNLKKFCRENGVNRASIMLGYGGYRCRKHNHNPS